MEADPDPQCIAELHVVATIGIERSGHGSAAGLRGTCGSKSGFYHGKLIAATKVLIRRAVAPADARSRL